MPYIFAYTSKSILLQKASFSHAWTHKYCFLSFTAAPTLEIKHKDTIMVKAGSFFRMDASFRGTPPPKAEWMKEDKKLAIDGIRVRVETSDYGTAATIKTAVKEDAGTYTVTVTNKAGSESGKIKVVVLGMYCCLLV